MTPVCSPDEVVSCQGDIAEVCAANQLEVTTRQCEFGCNDSGCLPCPPGGTACREIEPGVSEIAVCAEDGSVVDQRDCVLGCVDGQTCTDILPSNDLDADLAFIDANLAEIVDLELGDGFAVHSDGTITDGDGQAVAAPSSRERMPGGGPAMRVFRVRDLAITGSVSLVGSEVIAFVANGDITISGELTVLAGAVSDPANDCVGDPGTAVGADASGAGGGGFESNGGRGGDVDGAAISGGDGGVSFGNSSLVPLFGGCAGGGEMGGGGGGGLQLVSRGRIVIGPTAGINAGGRGGSAPVNLATPPPAGGGGSGGGILLEAPLIEIAESGFVAANGGGGACTAPMVVEPGTGGLLSAMQAPGGDCQLTNSGVGGAGGSKADNRENGQTVPETTASDSGGGAGGSVGRIRVNSVLGAPSTSRFSPDPSVGTLETF